MSAKPFAGGRLPLPFRGLRLESGAQESTSARVESVSTFLADTLLVGSPHLRDDQVLEVLELTIDGEKRTWPGIPGPSSAFSSCQVPDDEAPTEIPRELAVKWKGPVPRPDPITVRRGQEVVVRLRNPNGQGVMAFVHLIGEGTPL